MLENCVREKQERKIERRLREELAPKTPLQAPEEWVLCKASRTSQRIPSVTSCPATSSVITFYSQRAAVKGKLSGWTFVSCSQASPNVPGPAAQAEHSSPSPPMTPHTYNPGSSGPLLRYLKRWSKYMKMGRGPPRSALLREGMARPDLECAPECLSQHLTDCN